MLTLPAIPGPYPVGSTTFAVPVPLSDARARVVGTARLKRGTRGRRSWDGADEDAHANANEEEPALKLEEVAFTAFYPADVATGGRAPSLGWVPT